MCSFSPRTQGPDQPAWWSCTGPSPRPLRRSAGPTVALCPCWAAASRARGRRLPWAPSQAPGKMRGLAGLKVAGAGCCSQVPVTRDLCPASRPHRAWHGGSLVTVAQEGDALPLIPLLPLAPAPAPAPGKIFGITKKVQPWRNPTGTAIQPRHHQSQKPVCTARGRKCHIGVTFPNAMSGQLHPSPSPLSRERTLATFCCYHVVDSSDPPWAEASSRTFSLAPPLLPTRGLPEQTALLPHCPLRLDCAFLLVQLVSSYPSFRTCLRHLPLCGEE